MAARNLPDNLEGELVVPFAPSETTVEYNMSIGINQKQIACVPRPGQQVGALEVEDP